MELRLLELELQRVEGLIYVWSFGIALVLNCLAVRWGYDGASELMTHNCRVATLSPKP